MCAEPVYEARVLWELALQAKGRFSPAGGILETLSVLPLESSLESCGATVAGKRSLPFAGRARSHKTAQRLRTFSPREIPETPERTTSSTCASPTALMNASSLSVVPVSCTVYTVLVTSTI